MYSYPEKKPADGQVCTVVFQRSSGETDKTFGKYEGGKWTIISSDEGCQVTHWVPVLPQFVPLIEPQVRGWAERTANCGKEAEHGKT